MKQRRDGHHVRLYDWQLAGAAYRAASCNARCLLVELKRLYMGRNNGELFLSVRRAAMLLNVDKNTAVHAFEELTALGFIKPRVRCSWRLGVAACWTITEHEAFGQSATKDFASISEKRAAEIVAKLKEQRRAKRKSGVDRKKIPSVTASDALCDQDRQCVTESDTSGANCVTPSDTFAANGSKSVRPGQTHLVYQGRGATQALTAEHPVGTNSHRLTSADVEISISASTPKSSIKPSLKNLAPRKRVFASPHERSRT